MTGGLDILLQPRPQLTGTDETGAKAKTSNESSEEDGYPRYSIAVQLAEDGRSMTFHGQGVE